MENVKLTKIKTKCKINRSASSICNNTCYGSLLCQKKKYEFCSCILFYQILIIYVLYYYTYEIDETKTKIA